MDVTLKCYEGCGIRPRTRRSAGRWRSIALAALGALLAPGAVHAAVFSFDTVLTGDQVRPTPVMTTATGSVHLEYDTDTKLLSVDAQITGILISDLNPVVVNSPFHLHVGPAEFIGPHAVVFGTPQDWDPILDPGGMEIGATLSIHDLFVPDAIAAAGSPLAASPSGGLDEFEAALLAMDVSQSYVAVHSFSSPGGEIRGNLGPIGVPEPSAAALMGLLLAGIVRRLRSE